MKHQEIALTTTENLVDNILLASTNGILEEIAKAIPVAGIAVGLLGGYKKYRYNKQASQILNFVQEGETLKAGTLLNIFKNPNNLEMGMEILNSLDQCYLQIQSQMMARLALLYDVNEITRDKFLKYSHIIPKLSSHLLIQLEKCYQFHLERKHLEDYKYRIFSSECDGAAIELTSYSFLIAHATAGGGDFYQATDELIFFYTHIYKNKHDRQE